MHTVPINTYCAYGTSGTSGAVGNNRQPGKSIIVKIWTVGNSSNESEWNGHNSRNERTENGRTERTEDGRTERTDGRTDGRTTGQTDGTGGRNARTDGRNGRTDGRNGSVLIQPRNQELLNTWKKHMAIMQPFGEEYFTPKHHLMFHLILRTSYHGNPWDYHTFWDESLNKELKQVCRLCHQANFESVGLIKMSETLIRMQKKRPRS